MGFDGATRNRAGDQEAPFLRLPRSRGPAGDITLEAAERRFRWRVPWFPADFHERDSRSLPALKTLPEPAQPRIRYEIGAGPAFSTRYSARPTLTIGSIDACSRKP